ncbi:hypothetical protein EHQ81_19390 [Leptospira selangorensis]|uniref:Uncharacterized protein n=1 Tax=Leptospira selangorensis TaxID=2484982 RepID=A0A5F2C6F7_9LEPT|nr:hypothetical protein EHQ81_19390 [Leptospira selangorensis]TGM27935.1 hypothetical protein EHQ82_01570 [Leptospira selangorensis]
MGLFNISYFRLNTAYNYRCFRSARSSLTRLTRSGYATFASVTSFAVQTRAIANVGTPWSLGASFKYPRWIRHLYKQS